MTQSSGKGSAKKAAVETVDHAPPTPAATMKSKAIEKADAAVAAAEAKVEKQQQHVAESSGSKRRLQQGHLKAAQQALAEAVAARKELT